MSGVSHLDVTDDGDARTDDNNDDNDVSCVAETHNGVSRDTENENNTHPCPSGEKGSKSSKKRKRDQSAKHPMLSPCSCKQRCGETFSHPVRTNIHSKYWEMPYNQKQTWLWWQMNSENPARTRIHGDERQNNRNRTVKYSLLNVGVDILVCQRFFLRTFGYTCNTVLRELFKKMTPTKITPPESKRGKHEPKHKLAQETVSQVKGHINSFNPSVSHYRRAHAPLRKYLPPELTIQEMYNNFNENSSGLISYPTYQRIVQSMNISFTKLGEEECEICEIHILHTHDKESLAHFRTLIWKNF